MKVSAIVQARTSSSRLPRKVLKPLPFGSDLTVLQQVLRRTGRAELIEDVILATTRNREDDVLISVAEREGVRWFRGSDRDVLERYYLAAKENSVDVVVRITSDCPCIDWNIIDRAVTLHLKEKADYTATRDFPVGLSVEVISFPALERAFLEAERDYEREHVCPYIYLSHPEEFRISYLYAEGPLKDPDLRITLDTEEDYALLCAVYDFLYYEKEFFTAEDVVELFRRKGWLRLINRKILQKKPNPSLREELEEALRLLKLQGLERAAEILRRWKI